MPKKKSAQEEKNPRILVAALITKPDTLSFLLTKHAGNQYWHFPDGERVGNESFALTLHRSVEDDLGVVVSLIRDVVCMPTFKQTKDQHILTLHFVVNLIDQDRLVLRQGLEYMWLGLDPAKHPPGIRLLSSTSEVLWRLVQ